jgi:hypothetical protein
MALKSILLTPWWARQPPPACVTDGANISGHGFYSLCCLHAVWKVSRAYGMRIAKRARARACEKQGLSITADRANVGQSSYKLAKDVLFYRWDPSDVMIFAFSCLIATLQRVAHHKLT